MIIKTELYIFQTYFIDYKLMRVNWRKNTNEHCLLCMPVKLCKTLVCMSSLSSSLAAKWWASNFFITYTGKQTEVAKSSLSSSLAAKWCAFDFLSPPVLMHGGLIGIAFCPFLCPSGTNTRKKVTRKKFISQEPFDLGSPNFTLFCALMWLRGQKWKGSRSQEVKVKGQGHY